MLQITNDNHVLRILMLKRIYNILSYLPIAAAITRLLICKIFFFIAHD